jgi:hypothetical protein
MVGVLRGGFTKSRKPSDLAEERRLRKHSSSVNLRRIVGSGPTGSLDHSHISHLGVSGGEESKPL